MSQIEKRLQALESKRQPVLGLQVFWECYEEPGLFREGARQGPGLTYTREALSELSRQGAQLILVHYTAESRIEQTGTQTIVYIPDNHR